LGGEQLGIDGQIYPIGLKGGHGKAQFFLIKLQLAIGHTFINASLPESHSPFRRIMAMGYGGA
jgi:hypothetical protein